MRGFEWGMSGKKQQPMPFEHALKEAHVQGLGKLLINPKMCAMVLFPLLC